MRDRKCPFCGANPVDMMFHECEEMNGDIN